MDRIIQPSSPSSATQPSPLPRAALSSLALVVVQGISALGEAASPSSNPAVLDKTVVTGQAGTEVSLPKFTEPLRDTPQSITVVPRELLEDQGATTLRDALRNVAGISLAAGEGGSQGDSLTLRGFAARGDLFLDGMRDFGSYYRDPFNLESVAALRGPESVMFGRGTTGGVIEQESKSPRLKPSVDGTLSLGTDLTRRATLDWNAPVSQLGSRSALRVNGMVQESQVAGRDIAENRRFGVAPSLAFGIGADTEAIFSYSHQTEDNLPDYGIPWLLGRPAPVDHARFYGFRSDHLRTDVDLGTARVSHRVGDALTLRDQFRYAHYDRDFRITEPQATTTLSGGAPGLATPPDQIVVRRNQLAGRSTETMLQNQVDAVAHFDTGPVSHALVTGVEAGRETSDPTRFAWTGVPTTSLLNPDTNQAFAGTSAVSSELRSTATTVGLFAVDTLSLGEQWDVSGGFRWDRFDAEVANAVTKQSFNRVDEMPSWRGALVYKPAKHGSVYFAYGTSFNPSAESLALTAGNANLPPEENESFELGSKWDLFSGRLTTRGALFRTEKSNARETNPANANEVVLAGQQRVQGAELEVSGKVAERWRIAAGYAFMESQVLGSRFFPASVGYPLANVPRHTFSLWNTWELPRGFEAGSGIRYVSSRTASSTVPLDPVTLRLKEVPGYWTLDAMLKYRVSQNLDLQVNVYNLTDRDYIDQIHPGHLVPGAGISALFSAHLHF